MLRCWKRLPARRPVGGHFAETGQAPLENPSHDAAGDHDIGVRQPVSDLTAIAFGLDDARRTEHSEVLRDVWLGCPDGLREAADLDRTARERVQDL